MAIVTTVDVITPLVDDPYTFGAISSTNSMSDIYAMGGSPIIALAILGFSSCDFRHEVIKRLLKGAVDKLHEAGAFLIGGHSIEDEEFKFGLAVIGKVKKNEILRMSGAKKGDLLILTKPIGTGILTSAFKKGALKDKDLKEAITLMLTLNDKASRAALIGGANAMTDVTGFGLLGHAFTMVKDSKINFVISYKKVPLIQRTKEIVATGIAPRGTHNNLRFVSNNVTFPKRLSMEDRLILSDPQTSGGLLIAMPEEGFNKFKRFTEKGKMPFWVIGEVTEGNGRIIIEGL